MLLVFFPLLDILSCSHFVSEAWKAMFKIVHIVQACSSVSTCFDMFRHVSTCFDMFRLHVACSRWCNRESVTPWVTWITWVTWVPNPLLPLFLGPSHLDVYRTCASHPEFIDGSSCRFRAFLRSTWSFSIRKAGWLYLMPFQSLPGF